MTQGRLVDESRSQIYDHDASSLVESTAWDTVMQYDSTAFVQINSRARQVASPKLPTPLIILTLYYTLHVCLDVL